MNPLLLGTIIYLSLGFVATCIVLILYKSKKISRMAAEAGVIISVLSAICMWMVWICMYMMQMSPLLLPVKKLTE
ncbi:V-type ATP synthase, Subunit V0-e [Blastocystis sp. ATCC 50177/Nand II]|uniref:V-type ATP synthase, Subunit V0-e n=1 Tax=Blastocystis sp. subtype 1 (strain ATCC 50177 / NandII) TaxID=478820 RepID=A0A196S5X3_BLAHN|nr:V-type ATP synthase, Subunit V0-e [Blastocystis sp. ATCC 50177/Nand II]